MPWERTADFLGGVSRQDGYKDMSLFWGFLDNSTGPAIIPLYLILGY